MDSKQKNVVHVIFLSHTCICFRHTAVHCKDALWHGILRGTHLEKTSNKRTSEQACEKKTKNSENQGNKPLVAESAEASPLVQNHDATKPAPR